MPHFMRGLLGMGTSQNALAARAQPPVNGLLGKRLAPAEEIAFQVWAKQLPWFQEFQKQYGEAPDLNAPEYDYRAAYMAGVTPQRDQYDSNRYHWPSSGDGGVEFKAKNHPTAWKEDYMRLTNGRDPSEPGTLNPYQANALSQILMQRYGK